MALAQATIKAAIIAELGPVEDPSKQADFAEAMATVLFDLLTAQATVSVTVVGGSSSGVHTGVII